jgi:hypothetical protein
MFDDRFVHTFDPELISNLNISISGRGLTSSSCDNPFSYIVYKIFGFEGGTAISILLLVPSGSFPLQFETESGEPGNPPAILFH